MKKLMIIILLAVAAFVLAAGCGKTADVPYELNSERERDKEDEGGEGECK